MDYLGLLEGKQWLEISEDFNYARLVDNFVGLRLFPMVRTENMKLAVAQLVEGSDVPVMALVHALDTEAQIGDRPDYQEIDYTLMLVKKKLNEGEALRKKLKDLGMSNTQRAIVEAVYNDAANLIASVITRFEVMADEALCSGKLTINENNVNLEVDYHLPEDHRLVVSGWSTASHDILSDLVKIKKNSKNKIVRALTSDTVMGYIVNNTKLQDIATKQGTYVTEDWARNYISNLLGIEFIVVDGTYKDKYQGGTERNFFAQDVISFLTTTGELGKTYMTSTPSEDCDLATNVTRSGFVSVRQYLAQDDPLTVYTIAEGLGLPVFQDIKQLYVCKVNA